MSDVNPLEIKLCKNCNFYKNKTPYWLNLIPIIGTLIFLVWKSMNKFQTRFLCMYNSERDLVHGSLTRYVLTCSDARESRSCGSEGKNYVSKKTPLQKVSNNVIMEEVLKRGLLNVMKDYKRTSE